MLESLSLAAGLSWASGLRLYLTVFIAGLFERIGLIHLPDSLAVLASPWVIGVAGFLTVVEFLADKIPALESAGPPASPRAANSPPKKFPPLVPLGAPPPPLSPFPAGAVLAAGSLGHADPAMLTVAALAGGTLAGASHFAKAGTRALIN